MAIGELRSSATVARSWRVMPSDLETPRSAISRRVWRVSACAPNAAPATAKITATASSALACMRVDWRSPLNVVESSVGTTSTVHPSGSSVSTSARTSSSVAPGASRNVNCTKPAYCLPNDSYDATPARTPKSLSSWSSAPGGCRRGGSRSRSVRAMPATRTCVGSPHIDAL